MNWLKLYDGADVVGRIEKSRIIYMYARGSGTIWNIAVYYDSGTGPALPAGAILTPSPFPSQADAVAAIDNLILNGS